MKKCMSHVGKSHSTHIKESYNTYDAVTLHIWMNHVIDMHESCDTYESVMYLRKEAIEWAVGDECVITHTNESCHTYEWVYSIHTIKSHQTYGWVMSLQKNAIQSAVGDAWVMTHIWMANWVSFDFNVSHYSSCWGYSLMNTVKFKKKIRLPPLSQQKSVIRFPPDVWQAFSCRSFGALWDTQVLHLGDWLRMPWWWCVRARLHREQ